MVTCFDVERSLRQEMKTLSLSALRSFAKSMGVPVYTNMPRKEIEDECVNLELYAFVH